MQAPTTDQIREAIDSGTTGEKVGMPDPAVAPLGTDAEAAGTPPTEAERVLVAKTAPRPRQVRHRPVGVPLYIGLILAIAAVVVIIITLAAP